MILEFEEEGSIIKWVGNNWLDEGPISSGEFKRLIKELEEAFYYLFNRISGKGNESIELEEGLVSQKVGEALTEFGDMFKEPSELPPARYKDHKIHLEVNYKTVNVRPYRYL